MTDFHQKHINFNEILNQQGTLPIAGQITVHY